MKDALPQLLNVPGLLDKVQSIINKLRYRQHELEQEFHRSNDLINNSLLQSINNAGEMLDANLASSDFDADDLVQMHDDTDDNDCGPTENFPFRNLQINSSKKQYSSKSNPSSITCTNNSNSFHRLKKRIPTRWNTILIMLRSYASNVPGIEVLLRKLKHFDLILTDDENEIVNDLIQFLSLFESITTILSSSKSYPTINLYLLLRMEIESMLQITGTESKVIHELKCLLSQNLDKWLPVSQLSICGFLLDPSQIKINIGHYLSINKTTRESTLFNMIKHFKINHVGQLCVTQSASTSSPTSLSPNALTTAPPSSPSLMKCNLSIDYSSETVHNIKKIRDNLIQKHTPISLPNVDPVIHEIENYLKLEVKCDDVLQFWHLSGSTYPHLKTLAQIFLAIPATSTPSEQVFSTTGLIVNAKRTMLLPENIGKIQVIHDNYDLLKNK